MIEDDQPEERVMLRTRAKNILFKLSAMTLNYKLEEEPPKGGLDASATVDPVTLVH
jgi:hypothetical protein